MNAMSLDFRSVTQTERQELFCGVEYVVVSALFSLRSKDLAIYDFHVSRMFLLHI